MASVRFRIIDVISPRRVRWAVVIVSKGLRASGRDRMRARGSNGDEVTVLMREAMSSGLDKSDRPSGTIASGVVTVAFLVMEMLELIELSRARKFSSAEASCS